MSKLIKTAIALATLLISAYEAKAQSLPLPPSVIVNGNLLTGSFVSGSYASYSTNNYGGNGFSASLSINGASVSFGSAAGYWTEPYLISGGYMTAGYEIPGYTTPGYQTDGYYDTDGITWIAGYWVPETVVPPVWVNGYWVDEVWFPLTWVSTGVDASGTYARFAFQMTNGVTVQPADSAGNPWVTTPQFGVPALRVNGTLWPFQAGDATTAYDYYSDASGDGYVWVTAAYYGGHHPQLGDFSGTNSNGFFRDSSGTSVRLTPRNGDGSFLANGAPSHGPPLIWSDGLAYRFLTTDTTNGVDVYLEDTTGYVFVDSAGVVSGLVEGTYADFVFQGTAAATFAGHSDGSPLPAESLPQWGPAALYVTGASWRYRGSTSAADYYGGEKPGQVLSIGSNGTVTYSDRSLNVANVPGLYAGGVFSNLPPGVAIFLNPPPSSPGSDHPLRIRWNGFELVFDGLASQIAGADVYQGNGLRLAIAANQSVVVSDLASGNPRFSGTYNPAQRLFNFGSANFGTVSVLDGNGNTLATNNPGDSPGNLDVSGNIFTLGSWTNGVGDSINGFALSFTPGNQGSLLRFDATRFLTDWLWTRVNATNATQQLNAMRLDSTNILTLYTPNDAPTAAIVLNPGGRSRFDKPVRIAPQGDISMGAFTSEPAAP